MRKTALSTSVRFALFGYVFVALLGCGKEGAEPIEPSRPSVKPMEETIVEETEIRQVKQPVQPTPEVIAAKRAEMELILESCLVDKSELTRSSVEKPSDSDNCESVSEEPQQTAPPQEPEPPQMVMNEPKPDSEDLMRKALEHLAAKRRAQQEAESAAKNAAEDTLRETREKAVKELISEMVEIPGKSFKMGKTEVTQAQWEGVMGSNPSYFKYSDHPVDSVSWYDAQTFIKTLNDNQTVRDAGIRFRLPTPDEWEYVCRAGSAGDFGLLSSGQEGDADSMAWYVPNSSNGSTTHPVGKKAPNAWGFYDMHGNVKEWTSASNFDYGITKGGSFACWAYDVTARSEDKLTERKERFRTVGIRLCADGDSK